MTRKRAEEERCAEASRHRAIAAAFKAGDLAALRDAVDDPAAIPNGPMPLAIGACLEYAIYHSPVAFIRTLLDLGAQVNPDEGTHAGFPPVIAALSCSRAAPGAPARDEANEILAMLLEAGADPNQRGLNDWTALHAAVAYRNTAAVDLLLAAGADPRLRTRIDECETPCEMAEAGGLGEIAERLKQAEESAD